jgi:putative copper export protein/peroxiredoxin
MIEVIAAMARWSQLAANLILLGSCVFLAIASTDKRSLVAPWVGKLERVFPWLAFIIIAGLLVMLAAMAGQTTGDIDSLWNPEIWLGIVQDTRMGQLWAGRASVAVLLLCVVLYLRNTTRARWQYIFCGAIACLPLIAGSLASQTAAEELSIVAVIPYALHVIFAGIWLGALPALIGLMYVYVKQDKNKKINGYDVDTLKRSLSMSVPVMILLVVSGILVAYRILDGGYAALVATPYGWLLNTKILLLVIILIIASRVRSHWLPLFSASKSVTEVNSSASGMRQLLRIELVFAMLLLLVATVLASSVTPAKDALIDEWPYSFRFSIIATWGELSVAIQVWTGVAIAVLAVCMIKVGRSLNWGLKRLIIVPLILFVSGLAVALPPLTMETYPETYRRNPVLFDAISIANGAQLYAEHCVECHGHQGQGNGIKARTMSTKMPDMLTEPHTIEHTPGDFYHWITFGMIDTDMPGYEDKLSDEERWDLVNYVHALSRGYQARLLNPEIIPNRPNVQPPSFSYSAHDGTSGMLQDFREDKVVMLVVFSWPQSKARIEQLKLAYTQLSNQDMIILAVPTKDLNAEELAQVTASLPFPVVTQSASEIATSYAFSRRTLRQPDLLGRGSNPDHIEFLIDRYGYLRARWLPSAEESGWADINLLTKQVSLLNQEKRILPPPVDYVR